VRCITGRLPDVSEANAGPFPPVTPYVKTRRNGRIRGRHEYPDSGIVIVRRKRVISVMIDKEIESCGNSQ